MLISRNSANCSDPVKTTNKILQRIFQAWGDSQPVAGQPKSEVILPLWLNKAGAGGTGGAIPPTYKLLIYIAFHITNTAGSEITGFSGDFSIALRRRLHFANQINKDTFAVIIQIGQIIGEIGIVVADPELEVLAQMTVNTDQCAAATILGIG